MLDILSISNTDNNEYLVYTKDTGIPINVIRDNNIIISELKPYKVSSIKIMKIAIS